LKKGIKSITKQIELYEEKKKHAREEGRIELEGYYEKEIINLEKTKEEKIEMLRKS